MSADDSRALLERYVHDVWDEGDPEAVERFLAPGYRRHASPTAAPIDLAGQVERLKGFRRAFPDITIEVEDIIAGEDRVAFRSTMRGTHQGDLLGIPPTGRSVTVPLLDVLRIEDGLFVEQWGGPDMFDLVRQLGATVVPEG